MRIKWLGQKSQFFKNRKGSSIVVLAMVFVTFSICISGAIIISRALVVKSECRAFGTIWLKAILSEYDVNLLNEYGIMAYWGNEKEVQKRIDNYLEYSAGSKLDAGISKSSSELTGLELGIPENFIDSLENGFKYSVADNVIKRNKREAKASEDKTENKDREILNPVVLDTLPSAGLEDSYDYKSLIEQLEKDGAAGTFERKIKNAGIEINLVRKKFGNKVTTVKDTNSYLSNEWEYIIAGKTKDSENYKFCRNRLFLIRNALNLAYLYKDNGKREAIITVSELITPGPAAAATQIAIAEVWAAAETDQDIKALLNNDKVPIMKSDSTWVTDLGSIINRPQILDMLDEEARTLLEENMGEIESLGKADPSSSALKEGLSYDDYLLIMMMAMDENTRILRIMDLVQINMKFNHYKDFNMMEYYVGVRYNIKVNGRNYEFEEEYK